MNRALILILSCLTSLSVRAVAGEPFEIPIWEDAAPGSADSKLVEQWKDRPIDDGSDAAQDRHVSGVTKPTMTVYLPEAGRATGAMVLVLPGGGFHILAIDKEGHDVARWLNDVGIAAAVVKYRLPDLEVGLAVRNGCLKDVQRAIRIARHHADKWMIDPERIGVTGFSAGGYLTAAAGTMFDDGDEDSSDPIQRRSCRPDFIAPIYPLTSLEIERDSRAEIIKRVVGADVTAEAIRNYSPDQRVTEQTPPTFLVHAHDDRLSSEHSVRFYLALKEAGVPAELHLYSRGGHGYGIRNRGEPISRWPGTFLSWMIGTGIIDGQP